MRRERAGARRLSRRDRQQGHALRLHTFRVAPVKKAKESTAEAMLALDPNMPAPERAKRVGEIVASLDKSAKNELGSFVAGLDGRYVVAGGGSDPVRNPD